MKLAKGNIFFFICWISVFISGVFLFGCKKTEENKTPYGDYIFRGIIKSDNSSEPIKNIKVTIENFDNKNVVTGNDGTYYFEYSHVDVTSDWYFKLEDIDSTENGYYESKDTLIKLNQSFLHDYDGEWYAGRVESDIIISMKLKSK